MEDGEKEREKWLLICNTTKMNEINIVVGVVSVERCETKERDMRKIFLHYCFVSHSARGTCGGRYNVL